MIGYEACKLFIALNNHFFQVNYDYFAYHGKVALKFETYEQKRQDERHRYDRLGRKFKTQEELENFIVANLIEAKKRMWVGLFFGGDADDVYLRWKGRIQAAEYNFTSELKRVIGNRQHFNEIFKCDEHQDPDILKALIRHELSLETFVLLDACLGFIKVIDRRLGDDRTWMVYKHKATKYLPFVKRLNISTSALRKGLKESLDLMGVTE